MSYVLVPSPQWLIKKVQYERFLANERYKALFWLSLFHLLVITSSTIWFSFPSPFLVSIPPGARLLSVYFPCYRPDCAYFWRTAARRIIFAVMIPALLISYVISRCSIWAPGRDSAHSLTSTCFRPYRHRQFHGLRAGTDPRRDVFNRLRQSRRWWLAPTASTCSVTSATRWPFSSLPSGVARCLYG